MTTNTGKCVIVGGNINNYNYHGNQSGVISKEKKKLNRTAT